MLALQAGLAWLGAVTLALAFAAQAPADARAMLGQLETAWDLAYQTRQTDALAKMLADEYVHTDASGARLDKTEYLRSIVRAPEISRVKSWSSDKIAIEVSGGTAVVTGESEVKGRTRGRGYVVEARYQFTDRWVRRDGQWLAVSTTARRIDPD